MGVIRDSFETASQTSTSAFAQNSTTTGDYGDTALANTGDHIHVILSSFVFPFFFKTVVSLFSHATQEFFNNEIKFS